MAGSILKILRTLSSGQRPNARSYGEPYVNFAENQFGVIDNTGNARDLLGAPLFSTTTGYASGVTVTYGGKIYISNQAVTPGAFNSNQWDPVATQAYTQSAIKAYGVNSVNAFHNPGFIINQRGSSGSIPVGLSLDRWILAASGAPISWYQRYNGFGAMRGAGIELVAAPGMTQLYLFQRIESFDAAAMLLTNQNAPQPVTVSFTIYNGSPNPFTPQLETRYPTSGVQDSWGSSTTVDLAPVNLQTIPAGGTGVVAYTFVPNSNLLNGYQVELVFNNALNGTGYFITVSNADIRATPGIPVGINNNPPRPEIRPASLEMLLCQRYYRQVYGNGVMLVGMGPTVIQVMYQIPVPMRIAPIMALVRTSVSSGTFELIMGGVWVNASGLSFNVPATSPYQANAQWQGFSGLVAPAVGFTNFNDLFFTLSAEFI